MQKFIKQLKCSRCDKNNCIIIVSEGRVTSKAFCRACGYQIPIHRGIPSFAAHISSDMRNVSAPQRIMNSNLCAVLYESPIWRPLHTYIGSGITLAHEIRIIKEIAGYCRARLVVDLACGTGHYARAFANALPEAEVVGLDVSLSMLCQARKRVQRNKLNEIIFLRGDIHLLPFEDNSVCWVHCGGALHLFPDLSPIWSEIARVLKPGGVFTGMTIALTGKTIRKIQQRLMCRKRATFFVPEKLAVDLKKWGLHQFQSRQHRIILLFSAIKSAT